jgi:hypothetical protein
MYASGLILAHFPASADGDFPRSDTLTEIVLIPTRCVDWCIDRGGSAAQSWAHIRFPLAAAGQGSAIL